MPLIGPILTALGWLFRSNLGSWITTALIALGIGFVTKKFAVDPWLDQLKDLASPGAISGGSLGAVAVQWIGLLRFDEACTMIASSIAAKFAADTAKAVLVKRPT